MPKLKIEIPDNYMTFIKWSNFYPSVGLLHKKIKQKWDK